MRIRRKFLAAIMCVAFASALVGCDSPEEKEARYIKRGNELFAAGEFAKAKLEYKNAARLKPTAAEPFYRMALVDESEGDLRNAFAGFSAAEQQDSHFHPAVLKIAQYYMAAEQYEETMKRISAVLGENPNDPEAHALLAAFKLKEQKFDEVESEARKALAIDPDNITAFSALVGLYSAKGELEKAVLTLDDGIARNPSNLALPMLRVVLYEKQNNLPKVAEAYEALFKLKPDEIQLRVNLANEYLRAGKLDEAEASLRKGVEALPENWEMKHRLALFLGDNRSVDAAEKEIQAIMQAYPSDDRPYSWLADLYASHNAIDKAVALLNQIVDRGEDNSQALNAKTLLARISVRHGDAALAERLVTAVLDKKTDNREALIIRAGMSFDKGAYQNAVSDLRAILRNDPKDREALQVLGEALIFQGRLDLAVDTMKTLVDIDPSNKLAHIRLAQALHMSGDTAQALDMLSFVAKADPSYPLSWEAAARIAIDAKNWLPAGTAIRALDGIEGQHMTAAFLEGKVFAANGKTEEAIEKYTEVVRGDMESPLAEHAMRELADVYFAAGKAEAAARYFETLKTDSPLVFTLLGRCYSVTGKIAESAAAFDKAIAGGAIIPDAYIGRARLYLKERKQEQAIEVLKKGALMAPRDFRAPLLEADALREIGRYRDAVAVYEDILYRNPEMAIAANNMAEVIADHMEDDPAALEKARQAADRFSNSRDPLLLDTLAWVYFKQGKMDMAQTIADRAQGQEGAIPPQVYYHYGMILDKSGKRDAAKAAFVKATVDGANYPGIEEARAMLSSGK